MGGNRPEKAAGDRHHERGGNALAAHVADAEIEFFLPDEEVIKVAAHLLGGNNLSGHVDVLRFRIVREGLRKHGHLDVAGNLQFAFDPAFLFGYVLQAPLVPGGRIQDIAHQEDTDQLEEDDEESDLVDIGIDFLVRHDDGHRPAGAVDGGIEHVFLLTLVPDQSAALFAGEHGIGNPQRGIVVHVLRDLLDRVIHDQRRSRAHHQVTRSAGHEAVRTGISFDIDHLVGEPVQRDIGRQDTGDLAFIVRHGHGVGSHHHLAATLVIVGLGPVTAPLLQGLDEPFLRQIVISVRSELGGVDLFQAAEGIGGIQPSLLREIVLRKGNGRSGNDIVALHKAHVHDP